MRTVVYSCPFVPAEWIAAHGLKPERIIPNHAGDGTTRVTQGLCPYAASFLSDLLSRPEPGCVVMTTACDAMRRVAELVARRSTAPVFLMNVPATWETATARGLYVDEVKRLGRFLCAAGGNAPSDERLGEVMLEFEGARSGLRDARGRLSARDFSTALERFHRDGRVEPVPDEEVAPSRGIPVALVGGPLLGGFFDVFDLIEGSGGTVVLDGTTTGERTLPARFDRGALRRAPLDALANAYFGAIPDAFRRPNTALYEWLEREIAARGVRGILFLRYTFCDTWGAEARRMQEWSSVPLLILDLHAGSGVDPRTSSRIQAFLEVLQ